MKIQILAKPNSKKEGIEKISDSYWVVKIKAPATEGKANLAIIEAIAKELGIAKSKVQILKGETAKHKLIGIEE